MEFLTEHLLGGITGGLGVVVQGLFGWVKAKQDRKHELAVRQEDRKDDEIAAAALATAQARNLESGERTQEIVHSAKTIEASMQNDRPTYSQDLKMSQWAANGLAVVDMLRGGTRPVLTLLMLALTALFPANPVIAYMFTTAGTWWFGGRGVQKIQEKMSVK